jgi:hypothetical protein
VLETIENVEHTVTTLLVDRQTWRRFRDAVEQSPAVRQTHFPGIVARWMVQSILVGLRRLGDCNPRTHSLRALFDRMIAHSEEWSFAMLVDIWSATPHPYDPELFLYLVKSTYEAFANVSGKHLNVGRVEQDRDRLDAALEQVKVVVDKTIAHADRFAGEAPTMTYKELDAAIDECHDLAMPYIGLLTGRGYGDMTPTEQYAWWRIFESWPSITLLPEEGD